jgi:cytoskeletal protein CcmA (bactofilin family)
MFGKNKKSMDEQPGFSIEEPISSILGKEMKITGDMVFTGKARLDGRVKGDVKGDCLVLSESSRVNGNVEVSSLICQGKVEGDVKAQNLLVKSGGIINGSITVTDLLVESGGVINGEVNVPAHELQVLEGRHETETQCDLVLQEQAV